MQYTKITRNGRLPKFIEARVSFDELDNRLKKEDAEGQHSGAEHSFRVATPWYHLNMGYTNPYNVGNVHAELLLIQKHIEQNVSYNRFDSLYEAIKDKQLIFYGVGVGDTEIAFVDWLLKKNIKKVFVTGIDVNAEFLKNFAVALRNRLIEESTRRAIFYRAYNSLFDQISPVDLRYKKLKKAHICLGGTIGNFSNQKEIIKMFEKLSESGDVLIIGIQLDTNFRILFNKYRNNSLFTDFVLSYIPKKNRRNIYWSEYNDKGIILARHKGVEVFRTTKYNLKNLKSFIESFRFSLVYEDSDDEKNIAIQLYKKIN